MAEEPLLHRLARLTPAQRALVDRRHRDTCYDGHGLIADTLAALHVTHVYGVPGQPMYDTFAACARAGLRIIDTHHQQSAALMAAAQNYLGGAQRAVCLLSRGAPAASALTAAIVARENCWPLAILAGAPPLRATGAGYFMDASGVDVFRAVTKSAATVPNAPAIPDYLGHAFDTAMSGRPGPVFVELPQDALNGVAPRDGQPLSRRSLARLLEPDPESVEHVATALIGARRPLLIAGTGLRWSTSFADLRTLVDDLALPFITSPMGRGSIPDTHPLCMNQASWVAQSQADLVLVMGARLDWTFRYGAQLAPSARIVHVDVHAPELSHPERERIRVHADAGVFLHALLREMGLATRAEARGNRDRTWPVSLARSIADALALRDAQERGGAPRMSPMAMARELRSALPDDTISILDGNVSMAASERMIPALRPASRLTPGGSGCLGVGVPYAIAAKLAHPDRPVVAVCGDFSFGVSALEMETAARHNLAIVVVVANNGGNGGAPRHMLTGRADTCTEPIAMFQPGIRYDRMAEALGGVGIDVECMGDLAPALRRALASGRPTCINVAIDPDVPFPAD